MESTAFFEKKLCLTPSDFNLVKRSSVEDILLKKAKETIENKCSEHGFILSGSIKLISRSMGYFESARFTGDAIYYAKLEGRVIYPVDGVRVTGEVIRKNKMGLYVNYKNAIRIQIPRDLHLDNQEYDAVQVGDKVLVELKRSKFAINDLYILASGMFITSDKEEINLEEREEVEDDEEEEDVEEEDKNEEVEEEEEEEDKNEKEEEDEEEEEEEEEDE